MAGIPLTKSAVLYSALRSWAGVTARSVARAADSSSAAAPAVCGEAIEVPLNIAYPAGSVYPASTTSGCFNQRGTVDTADPGAITSGLNPPSSRGPRDVKLCRLRLDDTTEPQFARQVALEMDDAAVTTLVATPGSPTVLIPGPLLPPDRNSWTPKSSISRS